MRAAVLIAGLAFGAIGALAQGDPELSARDERIKELNGGKDYARVIAEINAQESAAAGTSWQDSLWNYIYPLGNAHWKLKGPEAGAEAAEGLYQRIEAAKRSPQWEVKALIKLSALYYDLSMMQEYERVGELALATATLNADRIPPIVLADAHYCMALTHMDLGRYEAAFPLIERAISIAEDIDPLPTQRLPTYFSGKGGSLRHLGRTREAEVSYAEGIAMTERDTGLEALSTRAVLLGNLAILVQGTGNLHRSKEVNTRALHAMNEVIARTKGDPQRQTNAKWNRTRILMNLASTYFDMADFDRAGSYLRTAQAERKELLGEKHPAVIDLNEGLAEVESMAGNHERAERLLMEQIDATEVTNEGGAERLMSLRCKLARMAAKRGQLARADSIYAEALPRDDRMVRSSSSRYLANALGERADLRIAQGRPADAISDLMLSRGIRSRILGPRSERLAEADVVISGAALTLGDTALARQFADSAIQLLSNRFAIVNGPFAPTAFRDPALLADAVMAKVAVERATRPDGSGEREWLQQLEPAFTSLHRNMSSLSEEGARLQMAGSHRRLFDLGLELAHAAHERSGDGTDLDRFLRISESDRSILLKSRLNAFTSLRYANVPDSVLTREQQLLKALNVDPDDPKAGNEVFEHEEAYAAFLDTLRLRHPGYFALRYGDPSVTVRDLREQLVTDQRDLLAYAVTGDHLYMLVVSADTAVLKRVSGKGIPEAVKALNASVISRDHERYMKAAHELHEMVFAPVAPLLRKPELLIIPDGELHRINFEALLSAPAGASDFRKHLLLQRYAIAYLLSATTAVQFSGLKQGRQTKTLALAPGFSDELKQGYIAQVRDSARLDRDFLGHVRQPFALSTAQELGELLSATVLVGGEADERGFRAQAKDYGILHLGTHAELNEHAPMYSRLVLSKDGGSIEADADGYLHAYEIYEMDLRAQLAVLTACETGAGSNAEGEGVRSLGYSFAYAGCPSLVTSLWEIDEKSSSEIIKRFYEHLADGMPKHVALRQAKLEYLEDSGDELALPYYWAGMVLVGDVEPIEGVGGGRGPWVWVLCLLAAVAALGLAARRLRRGHLS